MIECTGPLIVDLTVGSSTPELVSESHLHSKGLILWESDVKHGLWVFSVGLGGWILQRRDQEQFSTSAELHYYNLSKYITWAL